MKNCKNATRIFCTLFSRNSCTGGSQTVIIHDFRLDSCQWCSEESGGV